MFCNHRHFSCARAGRPPRAIPCFPFFPRRSVRGARVLPGRERAVVEILAAAGHDQGGQGGREGACPRRERSGFAPHHEGGLLALFVSEVEWVSTRPRCGGNASDNVAILSPCLVSQTETGVTVSDERGIPLHMDTVVDSTATPPSEAPPELESLLPPRSASSSENYASRTRRNYSGAPSAAHFLCLKFDVCFQACSCPLLYARRTFASK